jgi:hypothetical protein
MFTSRILWTYSLLMLIAAFLAYEVTFLHNIRSPGGWIAFSILVVVLLGLDGFARWKGVGRWKRVGLTVAAALFVFFANSASTLTRCDKNHQHCHRVFGI